MAEQPGHEKHDELVSPIAIPKAREDRRIEVRGQVEEQGEREGKGIAKGDKESNNLYPPITPLPRAVKWLGGELLKYHPSMSLPRAVKWWGCELLKAEMMAPTTYIIFRENNLGGWTHSGVLTALQILPHEQAHHRRHRRRKKNLAVDAS